MDFLILMTVVSCARMNIDAAHIVARRTTRGLSGMRLSLMGAVCGRILGSRHALGCR
jgi:hypothetical protein